jgi:hypothetical protein
MSMKKFCPLIRTDCLRDKCSLWVVDGQKVTNVKSGKSGIKDTSACAIAKMGEESAMNIWNETERIINKGDGID